MKISIMKHSERFKDKPTHEEAAYIQMNIRKAVVSIDELIEHLTNGGTIKPASLSGRTSDTWLSQQIYLLDFDHGTTIEEQIERAKSLGIEPIFAYTSFSHTEEEHRFRFVFCLEEATNDIRVRNVVQYTLMKLFNKADQTTKDPTRLFFGGRTSKVNTYIKRNSQGIVYENKGSRIDVKSLVDTYVTHLKLENSANFAKNVISFCESLGINSINGLPAVMVVDEEVKIDENTPSSILLSFKTGGRILIKIDFNITKEKALEAFNTKSNSVKLKKNKILKISNKSYKEDKHLNLNVLESTCPLYKAFIEGSYWAYHNEIFMMATNLYRVRGGRKRLLEAVEHSYYDKNRNNLINTINSVSSYGYAPKRCGDTCPFREECQNTGKNMLHSMDNRRCETRKIENIKTIDTEEAFFMVQEGIIEALEDEDMNSMHLIGGTMGIGKTEAYLSLKDYKNMCISAPTHKLAAEIADKIECDPDDYILMQELVIKDDAVRKKYDWAMGRGDTKKCNAILEKYIADLKHPLSITRESIIEAGLIQQYIYNRKACRYTDKLIICTHKRMMTLNNKNIHTYIVDEDFLMTSILPSFSIDIEVIEEVIEIANKYFKKSNNQVLGCLNRLKRYVDEAIDVHKCMVKLCIDLVYTDEQMEEFLKILPEHLNINIKELLSVKCLVSDINGNVLGMAKHSLPSAKFLILSATASEEIYKSIFYKRKINVVEVGLPEAIGKYVHHSFSGCSRAYMKKNGNLDKLIERINKECSGIKNLITYKSFKKEFEDAGYNCVCHFGACQGINSLKGEDLIVVGTPHIDDKTYLLIASLMNEHFIISNKMEYINIKRNGFEFWMYSYKESPLMQKIQLYLIESDLFQAIGRARALREDVTVHVYSSIPFPNSELIK